MKSLDQLYRLRPSSRALHLPGPQFVPPHWYRVGVLVRAAAKKHGFRNPFDLPPFDQTGATC